MPENKNGKKNNSMNILSEKTWTWLRKGNLIAEQNNAIRSNQIKGWINMSQQNSKRRLCGDRDKTINHIINECSKLVHTVYKTRHDWVGKVIHWELCKKLKFDRTNKWYMQNPTSFLENDTQNSLGFWHPNGLLNIGQTTRPYNDNKKKRI